jgi:pimeloyl-ACP methyl ester carboxylesterase
VLSNHGGLCSRLDVVPADEVARRLGIRLLAPDRPGVGLSTRQPGRRLLDWPDDIRELADRLGLDRFASLGWSLGGQFAAAVAFALGDRVSHLALVASTVPPEWADMAADPSSLDRFLLRFSRRATVVDRAAFRLMGDVAARRPSLMAKQSGAPHHAGLAVAAAMAEGLHDSRGALDEYRVYDKPWGFDPGALVVPTDVWQGDADDLVPVSWSEELATAILGAELHLVAGATHFLWYDHWDAILTRCIA